MSAIVFGFGAETVSEGVFVLGDLEGLCVRRVVDEDRDKASLWVALGWKNAFIVF
jgi:hypothetical protein